MTTMACAAGVNVGRDWLDLAVAPAGRRAFRPLSRAPTGRRLELRLHNRILKRT